MSLYIAEDERYSHDRVEESRQRTEERWIWRER